MAETEKGVSTFHLGVHFLHPSHLEIDMRQVDEVDRSGIFFV